MERSWKTRKVRRRKIIRNFHINVTVYQVRMEFDNKPWCIWTKEEKEINVWSSLALYFTLSGFLQSLGYTMECMYNPPYCLWICTIHTCAKWLQNKISTCMSLPVHTACPYHKCYRMRVLPTRTVLITLDRYFSKLGTYSSQSFFRNIPLFKTAPKKVSRKDEDA